MSARTDLVDRYMDGFRRSDHELVLSCLADDVTWHLAGHTDLTGKVAFDGEIENDAFEGRPVLTVDRTVEQGDTVVLVGRGDAAFKGGAPFRFEFCDVFVVADDLIRRVESYIVPLTVPLGA